MSTPPSRSVTAAPVADHATVLDPPADSPKLSYEAARAELGTVLAALESGGQPLEESLALWRRGEDLADICQRWLDDATQRLDEAIASRRDPDS